VRCAQYLFLSGLCVLGGKILPHLSKIRLMKQGFIIRVCFKRVTLNLAKVTDDAVEEMLSR
jgi:hypothetical protein